jgi:hypothetical protein
MVNGVLVERTVQDVLPTLKTNSDGLKQVLEDMLKQYKTKQSDLDNWKVSRTVPWSFQDPEVLVTCEANRFSFRATEEEQHPGRPAISNSTLVYNLLPASSGTMIYGGASGYWRFVFGQGIQPDKI